MITLKTQKKDRVFLSHLERKVLQEAYRLTKFRLLELRLALSPVIPRFEPSQKEMNGKKNKKTALKWRNQIDEIIWSSENLSAVSPKTYENILAPAPILNDRNQWLEHPDPSQLEDKEAYIVIYKTKTYRNRRGKPVCDFDIFYREKLAGNTKHEHLEKFTLKKTEKHANKILEKIESDQKIPREQIFWEYSDSKDGLTCRRATQRFQNISPSIVIHAIKIHYSQKKANEYILILLDRPSFYVKLIYVHNLKASQIVSYITRFQSKLHAKNKFNFQDKRKYIHFVTDSTGLKSTVLSLTKEELSGLFEEGGLSAEDIRFEPPVVFKKEEQLLAGDLKKIRKLQERLVMYQNLYNLGRDKEYTLPIRAIHEEYERNWDSSKDEGDQPKSLSQIKQIARYSSKPRSYPMKRKNKPADVKD